MSPRQPAETLQKRQCACGLYWLASPRSSDTLCPDCRDDREATDLLREQAAASHRAVRQPHREPVDAYQQSYYRSHRKQALAYQRAYYQAHRPQAAAYRLAYRQAHRERAATNERR